MPPPILAAMAVAVQSDWNKVPVAVVVVDNNDDGAADGELLNTHHDPVGERKDTVHAFAWCGCGASVAATPTPFVDVACGRGGAGVAGDSDGCCASWSVIETLLTIYRLPTNRKLFHHHHYFFRTRVHYASSILLLLEINRFFVTVK